MTFQENRCNVSLVTKTESNSNSPVFDQGREGGCTPCLEISRELETAVDIFMQMRLPFFLPSNSRGERCSVELVFDGIARRNCAD